MLVGGAAASTAAAGASVVRRTPAAITTTAQTILAGAIQKLDTSGGSLAAVNLPDPATSAGQAVTIVMVGVGNNFTLKAASGNINSTAATTGIAVTPAAFEQFECKCDGTDWFVVRYSAI
jgi:hypothetical protein